jgi:hypothetical protein
LSCFRSQMVSTTPKIWKPVFFFFQFHNHSSIIYPKKMAFRLLSFQLRLLPAVFPPISTSFHTCFLGFCSVRQYWSDFLWWRNVIYNTKDRRLSISISFQRWNCN